MALTPTTTGSAVSRSYPWTGLNPGSDHRDSVLEWEKRLRNLHRVDFPLAKRSIAENPPAVDKSMIRERIAASSGLDSLVLELGSSTSPPIAPEPEPIDRLSILRDISKSHLSSVSVFDTWRRWKSEPKIWATLEETTARERAERMADRDEQQIELDRKWQRLLNLQASVAMDTERQAEAEERKLTEQFEERQARLDREWEALLSNDPDAVHASVEGKNPAEGVPFDLVDVDGETLLVEGRVQPLELMTPERRSSVTPGGKPTTKKLNKTERSRVHLEAVAGSLINVAKQALAASPGASMATVLITVDPSEDDVLMFATLGRSEFLGTGTNRSAGSVEALERATNVIFELGGRTKTLVPLPPELVSRHVPRVRRTP